MSAHPQVETTVKSINNNGGGLASPNDQVRTEAQKQSKDISSRGVKAYVKPQVQDETESLLEQSVPGQKRKRPGRWGEAENDETPVFSEEEMQYTPTAEKHVKRSSLLFGQERRAGSYPVIFETLPCTRRFTPTAPSVPPQNKQTEGAINTQSRDDHAETTNGPSSARSQTVDAEPNGQVISNGVTASGVTTDGRNAAACCGEVITTKHGDPPQPSKFAKTVMHAFDINQHAFDDAELCRRLRLYKRAISTGEQREASLRYKDFFIHLWESVGVSAVVFDLGSLISGICAYQEMAMTDMTVSHGILEIKTDLANGDNDGVKDRAGELWGYVWETYDSDEPLLE